MFLDKSQNYVIQQTHYFSQAVHPSVKTLVDESDINTDEVECSLQLNLILIGYYMCVLVTLLFILEGGLDLWWYTSFFFFYPSRIYANY